MPTPTPLSPALSVLQEFRRALGNAPPGFNEMLDAIFAFDEEKNGQHSLEFRRGLAACAFFTLITYHKTKPEGRDELIVGLAATFSNRYMELLEEMAPRPSLQ